MPPKKPPFALSQHLLWGMKLALIDDELQSLHREMLDAYPGTHARPVKSVIKKLAVIRTDLESKLLAENEHRDPNELSALYWPTTEEREAMRSGGGESAAAGPEDEERLRAAPPEADQTAPAAAS